MAKRGGPAKPVLVDGERRGSVTEAARALYVDPAVLSRHMNGKRKSPALAGMDIRFADGGAMAGIEIKGNRQRRGAAHRGGAGAGDIGGHGKGGQGMKDRYLFRGKALDGGEWAVGNCVCETLGNELHFIVLAGSREKVEIDPATLGQCTGLEDKRGRLVFEGDILQ